MESGRLEVEPTPVVCRRLGAESRTGCLHLPGKPGEPGTDVLIYLWQGRVYTATAPGGRSRLGDRLIGGGHVSQETLDEALAIQRQRPGDVRIGDVLVERGLVSRDVLRAVIREQICDSLAVALTLNQGEWRFADGEETAEDVPLGLSMEDALLEASRRLAEQSAIMRLIGSVDTVVDFKSTSTDVRVSLQADEWAMLTHIDGRRSIVDVATSSGYTVMETSRIIYGLLSAGVLRTVRSQSNGLAARLPTGAPDTEAASTTAAPPTPIPAEVADLLGELQALGGRTAGPPGPLPSRSPDPGPEANEAGEAPAPQEQGDAPGQARFGRFRRR